VRFLLAADGSPYTRKAVRYVAGHARALAKRPEILILHVRPPIPYPSAAAYVGRKAIQQYERDEAERVLKAASKALQRARIPAKAAWILGDPAKEIAADLNLSAHTIDTHRANIMRKLNVNSISELILYAMRKGIIH